MIAITLQQKPLVVLDLAKLGFETFNLCKKHIKHVGNLNKDLIEEYLLVMHERRKGFQLG